MHLNRSNSVLVIATLIVAVGMLLKFTAPQQGGLVKLLPNAQDAQRLRIALPGTPPAVLEKFGQKWRIVEPFDFAADAQAVDALLAALSHADRTPALGAQPDKHAFFQLTAKHATRLTVWQARTHPELDIWIGRPASGYDTAYTKDSAHDPVFEVHGLKRSELMRTPGRWADRVLCSIPAAEIQSIWLRRVGQSNPVIIPRPPGGWGKPPKPVGPLLAQLARWEAARVINDKALGGLERRGLEQPEFLVKITTLRKSGRPETLRYRIGPRKPGLKRLLQVEDTGAIYEVEDWNVGPIAALTPSLLPN
jgi:hypothetical protein